MFIFSKMSDSHLVRDRVFAAVLGTLVADAAVHPYNGLTGVKNIQDIVGAKKELEFSEEWHNPLCQVEKGRMSCYGEHCYVVMETIVENKGFVMDVYKEKMLKKFGTASDYNKQSLNDSPSKGPYRVKSIEKGLKYIEVGENRTTFDDLVLDCCSAIVPLVAFYAGSGNLFGLIEDVVRVTVNNDIVVQTVQIYSKILEYYIFNGKDAKGVEHVLKQLPYRDEFRDIIHEGWHVLKYSNIPHPDYVNAIGLNNELPVCFMAIIHGLISTTSYVDGIRGEILTGGSSCLRAGAIGACLAAQNGTKCIPEEWIEKTKSGVWFRKMANRLSKNRPQEKSKDRVLEEISALPISIDCCVDFASNCSLCFN